jgi:hypothetical protein
VLRRIERLLSDEDAVDGGGGLQAGGRVDDVTDRHRPSLGCARAESDVCFAGRDREPDSLVALLRGKPVADRERGADRPLRIVLVRDGRTEESHDGISDELLHRTAEALELGANVRVVGREKAPNVLRVQLLGGRGEVDEIGEEDADELPLLAQHRYLRHLPRGAVGRRRRSALRTFPSPRHG